MEQYLEDRELFLDGFYRYYTDFEPEHGWVACADGEVVGFLMGCVNTSAQRRLWIRTIFPDLTLRLLRGQYKIGPLTRRHALRVAREALIGGSRVDLKKYPAHLHMNVDAAWRGRGLGRRVLEAYLQQLRELEIPGVHLTTTSLNTAAGGLYENMGFRMVDRHRSAQWSGLIPGSVFKQSYALDLKQV